MARRPAKKKTSVKIDFSNIGKQFEADMEYAVEVKVATLEEGNEFPYFALQFKGIDEDYEDSVLYHNASTSPQALWRLKPLLEALGMDVPEDEMDLDADDFVGKQCMCSTVLEKNPSTGKSSVKPDEFWPLDDADEKPAKGKGKKAAKDDDDEDDEPKGKKKPAGKSKKAAEPELDLDAIDDADIKRLGKEFQITSKKVAEIREQLAEADEDEVREACADLDIDLGGDADDDGDDKDEDDEKPARGKRSSKKDEDDGDEEDEKPSRSKRGSGKSSGKKKPAKLSQDEVNDMSEEELDDLVEQHDLDLDLSEYKTLRKKKAAVIDALTEAGAIDD